MFDNETEDDDLFLSDIGSLSQIYDNKQRFGKNFNPNYKKRGTGKLNNPPGDKKGKPFVRNFDKRIDRNSKDANCADDNLNMNLYDDEDVQVLSHTKPASKEAYSDDRMYDDFELNVKSKEPKVDSLIKTKNDAPWRINREKKTENDAKRLLEYERSFKNDELLDDAYEASKKYPQEIETQAKTVRSLQRQQMKFNKSYSQWAYDDEFDNEDKSDPKDNTPYDPEQVYDESSSLFNREQYSNPENPYNELLDENYPNAVELPPYKFGKIRVENKLEEKLRNSTKEPKTPRIVNNEDEDVIILDDSLINKNIRMQQEIVKSNKIKISFNSEPKPKSVIPESVFTEESNSPKIRLPTSIPEGTQPLRKIPVLEREPPKSTPLLKPISAPVTTIPMSHTMYPLMSQNFNYNSFGGNVGEIHPPGTFMPDAPPPEFFGNTAPPGTFPPVHNWMPVNQTPPVTLMPVAPVDKVPATIDLTKPVKINSDEAVKEEIRQQNKKLMDQRDQYHQKYNSLNDELNKLKKQKKTLADKKSHQAEEFLHENEKLQNEIQHKIKAVKNIIDMLTKIIKDNGLKSNADSTDESSKRDSSEHDDNVKDHKKKRKHSRSRSKSRHRSRSRSTSHSRSRRSRSRSRHRSRSRSRSRYRRRSPSRSRDKYYRRRRSHSRDKKKSKRVEKEDKPKDTPAAVPIQPQTLVIEPVEELEKPKDFKISDRFKPSFEEVLKPVEPPKAPELKQIRPSRFADGPTEPINVPAVPIPKPTPSISKGWTKDSRDVNYVYFDPEIHWCRVCNVFPKTAKEYLLHLHAQDHKDVLAVLVFVL